MLPVVDPPAERTETASVAGVLLAAGTGARYGESNKLLVPVESTEMKPEEPVVDRNSSVVCLSARTLLDAGLDPVLVVVGYESKRIRSALADTSVKFVENPEYESGQASSVRFGVRALSTAASEADAAVFALGDMPYVDPESIHALVASYEAGVGSALAAGYRKKRGNPVLFDQRHFPALAGQNGDIGGKQVLLSASDGAIIETDDPGVRQDIDTPDDFV
jgi:molybdenum cofactor cytidylyltransferase